jgi:hypothetical protein
VLVTGRVGWLTPVVRLLVESRCPALSPLIVLHRVSWSSLSPAADDGVCAGDGGYVLGQSKIQRSVKPNRRRDPYQRKCPRWRLVAATFTTLPPWVRGD